jgi:predicted ester cyclase
MKYLVSICAACLCAVFMISCNKGGGSNPAAEAAMKADSIRMKNIESFKKVNDMFNSGKLDGLGEYIADSYVEHEMHPGQKPGLAGLKESMTEFHAAFPDMKFNLVNVVADSNMIYALFNITGTNSGPFMGMPATGKHIDFQAVDIVRLENGKCVEHWGFGDHRKMMEQMGMPMPGMPQGEMKMPEKKS